MSESSGEKSFAPSAKRKQDAARKGDVLRSREVATVAAVAVGAGWLILAGPWLGEALQAALRSGFSFRREGLEQFAPQETLLALLKLALPPVLLLGLVVGLASLASQLGFGEGRWLPGNLAPKASRLDPLAGLKRMFGPAGWIELAKGLAKVVLLGTIVWGWADGRLPGLLGLGRQGLGAQLAAGWEAITSLLLWLSAGLLAIALVDLPVQWLRRNLRLMMSMQDVRDEHKESEGSPERRAAQRQRQRQIAMGSVAAAMREAQFVITNPTHFAVAMAWDPAKAHAPVVLAKGRGDKALAMRELAAEHALPVLEYPALARSVYYTTREREPIREELYAAVASVLAFVLSLKRGEHPPMPSVEVPVTVRYDSDGRMEVI
jgi:flagellar biosynthesis protein FlhB